MAKRYWGFAIRVAEKETGIFFKRTVTEKFFSKIEVQADRFAEAQQLLCDKMQEMNMPVAIITPYATEESE